MVISTNLDELIDGMARAGESSFSIRVIESWGNPGAMSKVLASVRTRFDNPVIKSDRRSVSSAVLRYRKTERLSDPLEIKYVCIGAWDDFSGWCLLQDGKLLQSLLIAAQDGPERRRLKYFACLLRSYLSFPRFSEKAIPASLTGWLTLREWLAAQEERLNAAGVSKPLWFRTLHEHRNLLQDNPCRPYQKDLLAGGSTRLNEAFANLAVPADSWLREEAVFAQIQAGTGLPDAEFQSSMSRLLAIAGGDTDFKLSRGLSIRCVALLISRYAVCTLKPEHIALRDAALSFIGNPWLHRPAWDSHVLRKDGRADVEAREMVNGWLKVRLIRDFFDLLSEDHSADGRRLNYWLRFEPMIEDMWFVLGADAMTDKRKDYADFRQRAHGRLLDLVGATPTRNNAFLMRIGKYVIVEFGLTGNACFAYEYENLLPDIRRRLNSEAYRARMDIAALKLRGHKLRLIHTGRWEPEFDAHLCPLLGFRPPERRSISHVQATHVAKSVVAANPPTRLYSSLTRTDGGEQVFSRIDFEKFVGKHRLLVEDFRKKGGSLWVRTSDSDSIISGQLKLFGFTYKPGKGWWME